MKNLKGDGTFFYKTKDDQLVGVCILHEHNILSMGSEDFHKETTKVFKEMHTEDKKEMYEAHQNTEQEKKRISIVL